MEHSETPYIIPLTLAQANSFAARQRENYWPFRGRRFAIGCAMDEKLVGIVIAGKPIDEALNDGLALAVNYIHATGGRTAYGLREPHFKHFTLERYRDLYELRERGKVLVRIIFTIRPNGEILLLHAFIKRQSRDTLQALEQALNVLAQVRSRPELAAEYTVRDETS